MQKVRRDRKSSSGRFGNIVGVYTSMYIHYRSTSSKREPRVSERHFFRQIEKLVSIDKQHPNHMFTHSPDYGQHYVQLTDQWSHYNKILPWHKLSLHQSTLHQTDHLAAARADLVECYNMTPTDCRIPVSKREEKRSEYKFHVINESNV